MFQSFMKSGGYYRARSETRNPKGSTDRRLEFRVYAVQAALLSGPPEGGTPNALNMKARQRRSAKKSRGKIQILTTFAHGATRFV
jgi:hypothetical protein